MSKRGLAKKLQLDPNTVQKWRKLYINGGIELLLGLKNNNNDRSNSLQKRTKIYIEITRVKKGEMTFKEFFLVTKDKLAIDVKYNTFYKYVSRQFPSKMNKFKKRKRSRGMHKIG